MNLIIIIGAIFAFLLSLIGIEKRKVKKRDVKILDLEQEVSHEKKQGEVYKVNQEITTEAVEAIEEVEQQQEEVEEAIEEAESDEEVVKIANDIINQFNSK